MKTRDIVYIGLLTAIICVLAPFSLPIGSVPISLATFAVMLGSITFGMRKGTIATVCYIVIGAVGLPVFSGFKGGFSVLFGVTGGYIFGYILLALVSGYFSDLAKELDFKAKYIYWMLGMISGTILLYVVGTIYFEVLMKLPIWSALMACVFPFILGDLLKMIVVCLIGSKLQPLVKD